MNCFIVNGRYFIPMKFFSKRVKNINNQDYFLNKLKSMDNKSRGIAIENLYL